MGTSSRIGFQLRSGKILAIYCNWDGYPAHVGKTLLENYTTPEKVLDLLNLGNLSSLGASLGEKHDFNEDIPGICKAYGRDRGELNQGYREYANFADFRRDCEYTSFAYLFRPSKTTYNTGTWFYHKADSKRFVKLTPKAVR